MQKAACTSVAQSPGRDPGGSAVPADDRGSCPPAPPATSTSAPAAAPAAGRHARRRRRRDRRSCSRARRAPPPSGARGARAPHPGCGGCWPAAPWAAAAVAATCAASRSRRRNGDDGRWAGPTRRSSAHSAQPGSRPRCSRASTRSSPTPSASREAASASTGRSGSCASHCMPVGPARRRSRRSCWASSRHARKNPCSRRGMGHATPASSTKTAHHAATSWLTTRTVPTSVRPTRSPAVSRACRPVPRGGPIGRSPPHRPFALRSRSRAATSFESTSMMVRRRSASVTMPFP